MSNENLIHNNRCIGYLSQDVINMLKLTLPAGLPIMIGDGNIQHMQDSHPDDYEAYGAFVEEIIAAPDFVTVNPGDGSIRYIKKISEIVHVGVRASGNGKLFARTVFKITEEKLQLYASSGKLIDCKTKAPARLS